MGQGGDDGTGISDNSNSSRHEQWKQQHVVRYPELCGIGAGWVNIAITFPINKFSFRQQVESTSPQKAWLNLKAYFSRHGGVKNVLYVYRGCSIPLVQKTIANSIMYGVYAAARQRLGESHSAITACMMACAIAGGTEAMICTPLERCQTVLQDRRHDTRFKGLSDVLKWHGQRPSMLASVRAIYTGGSLIFTRNTLSTFNYFQIRDAYKSSGAAGEMRDTKWYHHAAFGCLSGALGCTMVYPINTVRAKIQTDLTSKTLREAVRQTYRNNSDVLHRGFYYGWNVAVFRSALSWGIQNSFYEVIAARF